jgi:flavodoxin
MSALVLYDSFYGNTEMIARAIGEALREFTDVKVVKVNQSPIRQMTGVDLLVVGSPTRAFRPSPETVRFLKSIPRGGIRGTRVAAFDTRIILEAATSGFLRMMMRIFGWAAPRIGKQLVDKGGVEALAPAGFAVVASEGPLKEGELERAATWARALMV